MLCDRRQPITSKLVASGERGEQAEGGGCRHKDTAEHGRREARGLSPGVSVGIGLVLCNVCAG